MRTRSSCSHRQSRDTSNGVWHDPSNLDQEELAAASTTYGRHESQIAGYRQIGSVCPSVSDRDPPRGSSGGESVSDASGGISSTTDIATFVREEEAQLCEAEQRRHHFAEAVRACHDRQQTFNCRKYSRDTKIPRSTVRRWHKALKKRADLSFSSELMLRTHVRKPYRQHSQQRRDDFKQYVQECLDKAEFPNISQYSDDVQIPLTTLRSWYTAFRKDILPHSRWKFGRGIKRSCVRHTLEERRQFAQALRACRDGNERFNCAQYGTEAKIPYTTIYHWYHAFMKDADTFLLGAKTEVDLNQGETTPDRQTSGTERPEQRAGSTEEELEDIHDDYSSHFFDEVYDPSYYQHGRDWQSPDVMDGSWPDLLAVDTSE